MIVVSSVSCIYGLGEPDDFARMMISLRTGMTMERDELLRRLVEDPVRAQRRGLPAEHVPGAGRHGGAVPGLLQGQGHPGGVFRRRDRPHHASSIPSPAQP